MSGITDNKNDPDLKKINKNGQQEKYLVLSEEERTKGFVRPVIRHYIHLRCHGVTKIGQAIAETYARNPSFYGSTFCCSCNAHFPLVENGERNFIWDDGSGRGVGE
jgi:hypothetical protein